MREIFQNNRLVDNGSLKLYLRDQNLNKYGDYWVYSFWAIPYLNDIRTRSDLPFTTPWGCDQHPEFMRLPKLKFTDMSLSDILDKRAIEIHQRAVTDNKKIYIMFSGGIDSTTLLTAFIKNIPAQELDDRYTIIMSANSIAENYYFYKNYIHNKFRTINWLDLDVTQNLLKDTIVLHGDPANALLSVPTVNVITSLVEDGEHLKPFRPNVGTVIDTLESFVLKSRGRGVFGYGVREGWAEWYVSKMIDAIPQYEHATSVAAFWWWHYINFKWHGSMLRPFFFTRSSVQDPVSEEEFKYYYDTCFYINNDFHHWSYSNIDRIVRTPSDYKPEMRDYIYELTHDDLYRKHKGFKASRRTNLNAQQISTDMPLVYDKNWVGHPRSNEMMKTVIELLNEYKG